MSNNSKLRKIFIISFILITFMGCDDNDEWIPNVRVNKTIYLTLLANVGILESWIIPEEGVNGILIFRLGDREFNAYDRTCSYRPSENCIVEPVDEEFYAACPCCGSEFDLIYDGIRKGPANRPLKKYQTSVSEAGLHIYN